MSLGFRSESVTLWTNREGGCGAIKVTTGVYMHMALGFRFCKFYKFVFTSFTRLVSASFTHNKRVRSTTCVTVSVHVSAGHKDNAPALLVVKRIEAHLALHHALQCLGHTPQPRFALLELGLARL